MLTPVIHSTCILAREPNKLAFFDNVYNLPTQTLQVASIAAMTLVKYIQM